MNFVALMRLCSALLRVRGHDANAGVTAWACVHVLRQGRQANFVQVDSLSVHPDNGLLTNI